MKPMIVASTRPELIKLSPVMRAFDKRAIKYTFVTTGQHYDDSLFGNFIKDLELRTPDYDIKVGSGSQAYQTSVAMVELERLMVKEEPDVVIVQGDTNSVLSSALAAVKLHIPVAHVEAGLRSFDKIMPEEINRTVADHCSRVLFAPTEESGLNLINEGIDPEDVHVVGNTVVDATVGGLAIARKRSKQRDGPSGYLVLTLHRSENVDDPQKLKGIIEAISMLDERIVFPVHPRTRNMLEKFKLKTGNISLKGPMGYLDFLMLLSTAKAVLTDSGGIQEEAIVLNVPCITLRTTTERPETVEAGGNVLAGVDPEDILEKTRTVLNDRKLYSEMKSARNPLGDGMTGERIADILLRMESKRELEIKSPDFTKGFRERRVIKVGGNLDGKTIGGAGLKVLKVIEDGKERFPFEDLRLKAGNILVIHGSSVKQFPTRK